MKVGAVRHGIASMRSIQREEQVGIGDTWEMVKKREKVLFIVPTRKPSKVRKKNHFHPHGFGLST